MTRGREVVVEPYDSAWPRLFAVESAVVAEALRPTLVAIHHIGSTSIAGIYAKPIIDMLAEVAALGEVDLRVDEMTQLGYEARGEFGISGRRYFRKDNSKGVREYQLHVFLSSSDEVERHLAFRDFLRTHPDQAMQYSEMKQRLAREHPEDIGAYIEGKDPFIKEIERRALGWRLGT